jgi:hypothetical protein
LPYRPPHPQGLRRATNAIPKLPTLTLKNFSLEDLTPQLEKHEQKPFVHAYSDKFFSQNKWFQLIYRVANRDRDLMKILKEQARAGNEFCLLGRQHMSHAYGEVDKIVSGIDSGLFRVLQELKHLCNQRVAAHNLLSHLILADQEYDHLEEVVHFKAPEDTRELTSRDVNLLARRIPPRRKFYPDELAELFGLHSAEKIFDISNRETLIALTDVVKSNLDSTTALYNAVNTGIQEGLLDSSFSAEDVEVDRSVTMYSTKVQLCILLDKHKRDSAYFGKGFKLHRDEKNPANCWTASFPDIFPRQHFGVATRTMEPIHENAVYQETSRNPSGSTSRSPSPVTGDPRRFVCYPSNYSSSPPPVAGHHLEGNEGVGGGPSLGDIPSPFPPTDNFGHDAYNPCIRNPGPSPHAGGLVEHRHQQDYSAGCHGGGGHIRSASAPSFSFRRQPSHCLIPSPLRPPAVSFNFGLPAITIENFDVQDLTRQLIPPDTEAPFVDKVALQFFGRSPALGLVLQAATNSEWVRTLEKKASVGDKSCLSLAGESVILDIECEISDATREQEERLRDTLVELQRQSLSYHSLRNLERMKIRVKGLLSRLSAVVNFEAPENSRELTPKDVYLLSKKISIETASCTDIAAGFGLNSAGDILQISLEETLNALTKVLTRLDGSTIYHRAVEEGIKLGYLDSNFRKTAIYKEKSLSPYSKKINICAILEKYDDTHFGKGFKPNGDTKTPWSCWTVEQPLDYPTTRDDPCFGTRSIGRIDEASEFMETDADNTVAPLAGGMDPNEQPDDNNVGAPLPGGMDPNAAPYGSPQGTMDEDAPYEQHDASNAGAPLPGGMDPNAAPRGVPQGTIDEDAPYEQPDANNAGAPLPSFVDPSHGAAENLNIGSYRQRNMNPNHLFSLPANVSRPDHRFSQQDADVRNFGGSDYPPLGENHGDNRKRSASNEGGSVKRPRN